MAEVKLSLTDSEYRALVKRADDERRSPNDMAAYLIVKALKPRSTTRRKPAARKARAAK